MSTERCDSKDIDFVANNVESFKNSIIGWSSVDLKDNFRLTFSDESTASRFIKSFWEAVNPHMIADQKFSPKFEWTSNANRTTWQSKSNGEIVVRVTSNNNGSISQRGLSWLSDQLDWEKKVDDIKS
ncbi:MAG: hypothetical protein WCX97_03835 [Candidatus Magasanikbacteria bacterium]